MAWLEDLTDDLIAEFLLRLPAEDPACLLRVSLVCKRWRSILADRAFRRRHRELHRPLVLGFICVVREEVPYRSRFVPIDPASRRPAVRILPNWLVLDCRHGRALFVAPATDLGLADGTLDFIVWDPLTNKHRRLPRPVPPPLAHRRNFNAAVFCAADTEGGDHLDCHRGNFHVAFLWSIPPGPGGCYTSASMYSSATDSWSELISVPSGGPVDVRPCPNVLVGDALYVRGGSRTHMFEYQLGMQQQQPLSVIEEPPCTVFRGWNIFLMSPQGGGVGFAGVEHQPNLRLSLWSREISHNGVAQWARDRSIELEPLLPHGAIQHPPHLRVVGFAEGTDVIFVAIWSQHGRDIYMVQFNSRSAKKVFELEDYISFVFPYTTFCVPVTDPTSAREKPGENSSTGQTQVAGN